MNSIRGPSRANAIAKTILKKGQNGEEYNLSAVATTAKIIPKAIIMEEVFVPIARDNRDMLAIISISLV